MRVVVSFDSDRVESSTLKEWRSEGLIRGRRDSNTTMLLLHEVSENKFQLPPAVRNIPLKFFISAEEEGRQVVCRSNGVPCKPYVPSLRCCSADNPSAQFMARERIVTVCVDEMEEGDDERYIFGDRYIFIKRHTVTRTSHQFVSIFSTTIWDGWADEYEPACGNDFRPAIEAAISRVKCSESDAESHVCGGPHYADLSQISDLAGMIEKNCGGQTQQEAASN